MALAGPAAMVYIPRMTDTGLATRKAAVELLRAVLAQRRPIDEALDAHLALQGMESRDRAFTRLLLTTTLRRLGQIDALIDSALKTPLARGAATVRDVLRLGLAQRLFLATPSHAAVDTSVELAGLTGFAGMKGLVNAVLRRLAEDGPALLAGQDAARLNTPDWLWSRLVEAYGADTAAAIAEAHLHEAPLDLSVKADPEVWAGQLDARPLPTGTLRREAGGMVPDLPGFAEGAWWVQDAAAALPARLFGPVEGRRILDLCSAPGGKTAQLAAAGAAVTAIDRSTRRLKRVAENLERLGLAAELHTAEAETFTGTAPYDGVLLDAPCSATGTIRRHPDVPRLKGPEDVARLAAAQARMLRRAVELVRPGGILIWCTCSLLPDEGEAQIDRLLAEDDRLARVPVAAAEIGGAAELLTPAGDVRTLPSHWPDLGGLDGFHIARLKRRS
ncbi:MAG: RsmB/NOP family class I SAM-dependent RNA methyltransferase [Inquilinus sp.]|uniref:RsmB/NOP family class I SAM-dependent RNA methyltransferase n=1 Tax=Inquilinus sp. TaxID=1932117 RepID=UPI003F39255C